MLSAARLPTVHRDRTPGRHRPLATDFLFGGGQMGALIRAMDWAKTPLGHIARWPQSLRTSVSLCIASNFPISLAWGPNHIQIYNDGYWPICGTKHPHAMGQDFSECWASAWSAIGEPFERALSGEAAYLENQPMFLDRLGYLEETFFTFSFSPIRDETGRVGGLFHPVTEMTDKMLSERRARTQRLLTQQIANADSLDDVLHLSVRALAESPLDVPFLLAYRITPGAPAHLAASFGLRPGTAASPQSMDWIGQPDPAWPFARITANGIVRVDGISAMLNGQPCGPYPNTPDTAYLIPVILPGAAMPAAILVAGTSSRLPVNDMAETFLAQIGATVSVAIANVLAFEQERQRAEALASLDRAKTEFFTNISHEFRTPLTLILGPVADALSDASVGLPDAQRVRLEVVQRNGLRLLKLVNALLEFSRCEAGRNAIVYEPADLSRFTCELVANFETVCAMSGLTLVVDCPALPEPVFIDRRAWETIVLNLVSNAIKFTFAGEITVTMRLIGEHAALTVRDTGTGIPDHEIPRLFERFHRVEGAHGRSIEGSGIGLALVEELVRQHGGRIEVSSAVGQGTEFRVRVPLGSVHLPQDRLRPGGAPGAFQPRTDGCVAEALSWLPVPDAQPRFSAGPQAGPPEAAGQTVRVRVLLADDNADMRGYVQRVLEESGYIVRVTANGRAALAAAREQPRPDLVISDVMMPELDGFGLLQALRGDPATADMLVILLSARAGHEARIEGLAAGANDYIVKPFAARELIVRVESALRLDALRREAIARELIVRVESALRLDALRREAIAREHDRRAAMTAEQVSAVHEALEREISARRNQVIDLSRASERSETLLHAIVETTPGPIYAKDRAGRFLLANAAALALIGKPWSAVQGRTDAEMLDDTAQSAIITANDQRVMLTGEPESVEEVVGGHNGHSRVWLSTKTPLRAPGGEIAGLVGVSLEITERKRDEARRELMIHELNHRVKNTLATVQAVASETLQGADPAMREAFDGRLMALSSVHDALTRESWRSVELAEVVTGALAPFGGAVAKRFTISCPPMLLLPRAAVALAMGLHELATNATKYGALRVDEGCVSLVWEMLLGDEPSLHMQWTETGGPPVVAPTRRSFGTNMIEGALAGDLGGTATISFNPGGVCCTIDAPLYEVAATGDFVVLPLVGRA